MHIKHFALIIAMVLVVIGCVLAAGCTSTPEVTPTVAPTANPTAVPTQEVSTVDPWIGAWNALNYKTSDGTVYAKAEIFIVSDGSAYWIMTDKDGRIADGTVLEESWIKTGDKTFTMTNPKTGKTYDYVYDDTKNTLTVHQGDVSNVFARLGKVANPDPWAGIWSSTNYIKESGTTAEKAIFTLLADGSAYWFTTTSSANHPVSEETWEKTGDNTFTAHNPSNGKSFTYVYNPGTDTLMEQGTTASNTFKRVSGL